MKALEDYLHAPKFKCCLTGQRTYSAARSGFQMEETDRILERVASIRPDRLLDVGCGCGGFTVRLSPHCREITAIDSSQALIDRCKEENARANITYVCMDGRDIRHTNSSFDLVAERMALHHIRVWYVALCVFIRVSSKHLLIEEPIVDARC